MHMLIAWSGQRRANAMTMHGAGEGGPVSTTHEGRGTGEHGLFYPRKRRPFGGASPDVHIQQPPEVCGAAVEQIICCERGEHVATVMDVEQPRPHGHGQEGFSGAMSDVERLADLGTASPKGAA
jgi:hypothetical protein